MRLFRTFATGCALGAALFGFAGPASANLITNGSFENCGVACPVPPAWAVYVSIPGWTTVSGPGIEIQSNGTLGFNAQDGFYYVELDSHANSAMEQTVAGLGAGNYNLSFYYRPRTGTAGDNGVLASVNGVALLPAPDGVAPANWALFSYTFAHGGGDLAVRFSAFGISNSLGGLIDTVSLRAVPEPGTLLLLGAALIGVTGRLRRRRS
jgi:hypothetical protein